MIKHITSVSCKERSETLLIVTVSGISENNIRETLSDGTSSSCFSASFEKLSSIIEKMEGIEGIRTEATEICRVMQKKNCGEIVSIYNIKGKILLPHSNPKIKTGDLYSSNYYECSDFGASGVTVLSEEDQKIIDKVFELAMLFVAGQRKFEPDKEEA